MHNKKYKERNKQGEYKIMSARTKRNIFGLFMLAILLVLGFIWDSGMLKTDNDYWIVLTLLMVVSIVGIGIGITMARKNRLEAEEKRLEEEEKRFKKMIDKKNNEDKHDEK